MDSFVDKLAQRFNAGEIIRANGEAEALETNRLKAQADEYDKILQEVRRLNLKTVELSEQVGQMIQCGIEQIESYQDRTKEAESTAERETQMVKEVVEQGIEKQKEDFLKIASNQQDMLIESIDRQQQIINAFTNSTLKNQEESLKRVEDRLTALRAAVEESLGDMELTIKSGTKDYEPLLRALHDEISNNAGFDENMNQLKEMLVKIRLLMEEDHKQVLDLVHKENVKVYRNVQAVVNDQTAFHTREILERIDVVEKKIDKPSVWTIVTLLLVAGSLAIQVLSLLGLI